MNREDFTLSDYKLSLFRTEKADSPLIIFNQFSNEGEAAFLDLLRIFISLLSEILTGSEI